MSQVEVAASLIGEAYLEYTINRRVPEAVGNHSPYAAPHGLYRCKGDDQWCAIAIFTPEEWERFVKAIGDPAWAKDSKFADVASRLRNVDELDKHVEEWTLQHDPREAMNILQAAGIAAGEAQRSAETIEDPQLKWLNALVEVDHPVSGKRLYPNVPFRISGIKLPPSWPAPLLGQHTEEICRGTLGMSEDAISLLREEGVLYSSG